MHNSCEKGQLFNCTYIAIQRDAEKLRSTETRLVVFQSQTHTHNNQIIYRLYDTYFRQGQS